MQFFSAFVLIFRGVGFLSWRQIYAYISELSTPFTSQPTSFDYFQWSSIRILVYKSVYAHNQDLCESWKFLSSMSELLIAYIKILINKSLKLMFSCANGVGLQPWMGLLPLVASNWQNWKSEDPEPATRKTDCLRPATGGLIHPSCTYFFVFDIDGLLFCSTGEGNRERPLVLFVYVLSSCLCWSAWPAVCTHLCFRNVFVCMSVGSTHSALLLWDQQKWGCALSLLLGCWINLFSNHSNHWHIQADLLDNVQWPS